MRKQENVAPSTVTIDGRVQRTLDQRRVDNIAANLQLEAIGTITLSRRPDGTLVCLDGQHRVEALKIAGHGSTERPMDVHHGLALEQEAELFLLLNNTRSLSAADKFRVALHQGEPEAVAVNDIVERNGFTTRSGVQNSAIAVNTLRSIYRKDKGDTLNRVLYVCFTAWGPRKHATHQKLLSALGQMLFRYGATVSLDRLVGRLQQDTNASNPTKFLGTIGALADAAGTNPADAGAGKLVALYNKQFGAQSANRLADWK